MRLNRRASGARVPTSVSTVPRASGADAHDIDPANIAGSPNATSNTFDSHIAPSASRSASRRRPRRVRRRGRRPSAASVRSHAAHHALFHRSFTTIGFISLIVEKPDARAPALDPSRVSASRSVRRRPRGERLVASRRVHARARLSRRSKRRGRRDLARIASVRPPSRESPMMTRLPADHQHHRFRSRARRNANADAERFKTVIIARRRGVDAPSTTTRDDRRARR